MRKTIIFSVLAAIATTTTVFAASGPGGGDPLVGLDLRESATQALADVKSHPSAFPEVDINIYTDLLKRAVIISSSDSLFVTEEGFRQRSTALSFIDEKTRVPYIVVDDSGDYKSWRNLTGSEIKKATGLHELSVLASVEKTGVYNVSQRYLDSLPAAKGLTLAQPAYLQPNDIFSFDVAQNLF